MFATRCRLPSTNTAMGYMSRLGTSQHCALIFRRLISILDFEVAEIVPFSSASRGTGLFDRRAGCGKSRGRVWRRGMDGNGDGNRVSGEEYGRCG